MLFDCCFALFVSLPLVVGLECFYCLFECLLLGVSVWWLVVMLVYCLLCCVTCDLWFGIV